MDTQYDQINKEVLESRLNRPASHSELVNSDNDSDLVSEVMWRLLKDLSDRVTTLENSVIIKSNK